MLIETHMRNPLSSRSGHGKRSLGFSEQVTKISTQKIFSLDRH